MANKQETSGYMDNVRVKISEKYKPPPRIGTVMSYAQRLTLNKQIQDTIPHYEFVLEKTVIAKMEEWRTARSAMSQQLNERLEKARSEHRKKQLEYHQKIESEEVEVTPPSYLNSGPSQGYQQSMLIPTRAAPGAFSNILTPIPLKEQAFNQNYDYKSPEKSPFNISDFEADTSSPFDNMELKSINDMEELALVLKSDNKPKGSYNTGQTTLPYAMMGASNYTYSIPNSSSYVQPLYCTSNGYYYPPETIRANPSFYSYSNQMENYSCSPQESTVNSVPDIMKTLQTELDNTHLDNTRNSREPLRNKSTETFPKVKTKSEDDEFTSLPKNVQDMSKSISSMGFPLSRVARVCKIVGNDQKKVVEHLLAMSELLDLGFPENSVSRALLECDNDRDKALDILIS